MTDLTEEEITATIPPGWRENARGHLVRESDIDEYDLMRDQLVDALFAIAEPLRENLRRFKSQAIGDIDAFVDLSLERYDVHIGGRRGNITLTSYDGRRRIEIDVSDRLEFDERIHAAQELIREFFDGRDMDRETRAVIDDVFQVDKKGKISTDRVLGLRKHRFNDPLWERAMDAIADSIQHTISTRYLRFSKRSDNNAKWIHLSMDLAKL